MATKKIQPLILAKVRMGGNSQPQVKGSASAKPSKGAMAMKPANNKGSRSQMKMSPPAKKASKS